MTGVKRRICPDPDIHTLYKELDEVSCPICMEHPHNAVLLLCSSHEKGCRSYICDTSYRHSNCLDQFKKLRDNSTNDSTSPSSLQVESSHIDNYSQPSLTLRSHASRLIRNQSINGSNSIFSTGIHSSNNVRNIQDPSRQIEVQEDNAGTNSETLRSRNDNEVIDVDNLPKSVCDLKCPMCRGDVIGWKVVEEARKYLNLKRRSCSRESCSFTGNYEDLRRHARRAHPTSRPSDVDPSREQNWRSLERQREHGDVVSAIHSAIPGAIIVGDYVIENGDRLPLNNEGSADEGNTPWWATTLFLFQMLGSVDGEPRARSRAWGRHRRPSVTLPERRFLWGENLLGLQDLDDDDLRILSDVGEDASPVPRRRRRRRRRLNPPRSGDRS